jgi:small subunit ribosomal protein S4e
VTKHLKRLAAPRVMKIKRKESKWTFRSSPGPHPLEGSVPLANLVRDYLGLCATGREAKRVIGAGAIEVDGTVRKNPTHPVGLMDVVTIPKTKQSYRMLLDHHGRLIPVPIKADEAKWKLCRVEGKTTVPGGKTQVNLHDGRNLLLAADQYKTGDVVKLALPDQKVLGSHKLEKGTLALVTGGSHSGELAPIDAIEVKRGPYPNLVVLKAGKDEVFRTVKSYVFPVGEKKPDITMPEVSAVGQ